MKHLAVPTFFLCLLAALPADAVTTNWVSGTAYGTNYTALASVGSISSLSDGPGSLIIGSSATTNLALGHKIQGFVVVTNATANFKVVSTAGASVSSAGSAAFTAVNATNLTITGGRFIGTIGLGSGYPPLPGQEDDTNSTTSAVGGRLVKSSASISGTEFGGARGKTGLVVEDSALAVSNGVFRGGIASSSGVGGAGLIANNSEITIHGGSFTGQVGNTAFYLENSDATIHGGTFIGNVGGSTANPIAGDGLFSELTGATTNRVDLQGGTFSSLAFYGVNGSVQQFTAGTNLVVQNGIIQNGGTVIVDNQSDSALSDIAVFSGTMAFPSNAFTLMDGGSFILSSENSAAVFGGLDIGSNALFHVGAGQLTADDLAVRPTGILSFFVNTSTNGFATVDTAFFQTNSLIMVDASKAGFSSGTNDVTILSAATGIYYGTTNSLASDADFTTNNVEANVAGRNGLSDVFVDGGKDLRLQFTTAALRDYWNVDGQLGDLADELDQVNNLVMMATIDAFDNPSASASAVEQTYFTTMNTFQLALQGLNTAVGQSVSRGTEFREQLSLPTGAKGPESEPGNEWRGWGKYYGQYLSQNAEGLNPQYDATLHGGVVGADYSIGNLLIGLSGGAGNYHIDGRNEADERIDAYSGSLYGTYGAKRAYLDGGVAYGYNKVKSETREPFVLEGEFDAQLISAFLGGGYDLIDTKGGTVFTPEASIQYSTYKQDAYSETSTVAVPRNIDSFDADSLRSTVGLNVSMLNTTKLETFGFKLEGRFHWIREFNPEPGNMGFSLEGGSNNYQFAYPNLNEDLYRAGIGFTCFNTMRNKPKNVLLRIDLDELFNQDVNSINLSAKVIYAF